MLPMLSQKKQIFTDPSFMVKILLITTLLKIFTLPLYYRYPTLYPTLKVVILYSPPNTKY